MELPHRPPFPALDSCPDAELIRLAQRAPSRAAAVHTLLLRYYADLTRYVGHLAHRSRLPRDLVCDAQQEAVLAVVEAVDAYSAPPADQPARCTFRTFLHRVVQARFYDFVRNRRRSEQHLERSADAAAALLEGGKRPRPGHRAVQQRGAADSVAEGRELRQRLEQALAALDAPSRWLWEQSLAGRSLHELAAQLQAPYHWVKYQRRKIRLYLAQQLSDWDERERAVS